MALDTGTLILVDYTAKLKDTGQIIETTRKVDAEKAGNADPTRSYEPKLVAVGEGWVLKGLDEVLKQSESGQTLDVEVTPDKAFGPRDPNKVSRIPLRKFGEKAGDLFVGGEVEVDNRVGIVRQIESGRALVDFNHRYAGKTLIYNVDIKQRLDERDAKIEALIRRRLPIEKEKVKFESEGETSLKVYIPNDFFLMEGLQIIKRGISSDLFKFIKPLETVSFIETYQNPAAKKEEATEAPKTSEAQQAESPSIAEDNEEEEEEDEQEEEEVASDQPKKRSAKKATKRKTSR